MIRVEAKHSVSKDGRLRRREPVAQPATTQLEAGLFCGKEAGYKEVKSGEAHSYGAYGSIGYGGDGSGYSRSGVRG
jgi:hypothetical protein